MHYTNVLTVQIFSVHTRLCFSCIYALHGCAQKCHCLMAALTTLSSSHAILVKCWQMNLWYNLNS